MSRPLWSTRTASCSGRCPRVTSRTSDETPWKQRRVLHYLWSATFGKLAVFRIDRRRDRAASRRRFAGRFHGVRIVDRLAAHEDVKRGRRQICWSHIDPDFAAFVDGPVGRRRFGRAGRAIARVVFRSYARFEEGRIARAKLKEIAAGLTERMRLLLTGAATHTSKRVRHFAAYLLRQIDALFVYAEHENVAPHDNAPERSLRGRSSGGEAATGRRPTAARASPSGC